MTFSSSSTYIYTYVLFAVVYLASCLAFVVNAARISMSLSKSRDGAYDPGLSAAEADGDVREVVIHSQRLIDFTQLAALLPLVYVVGSMFLGSLILGGTEHTAVNSGWIGLTAVAAIASLALAVMGVRESARLKTLDSIENISGRTVEALQRIGVRLGISTAVLFLVAIFMILNLFSVLSGVEGLLGTEFLI